METKNSKKFKSDFLNTKDGVKIAYNHMINGFDKVLVIAHGWFMGKDSRAFVDIAESFAKYYDVITFDFRGHCKSSGKYTFGYKETEDLSVVINYAKKTYKHLYLMGFSLGSLISINYCSKNDDVEKLVLVSAPTDFKRIENNVFSPNAFIPTFKKFEFKRWFSIRFTSPFKNKPVPINLIQNLSIPVFFIGGEKDPIIKIWHNHKLFELAVCPKKELIVKDGKHAEDIFLENKNLFVNSCVEWFKEEF